MKHYFTLLAAFTALILNAQDPQIEWQNTLGGDLSDGANLIAPSTDGGSVLAIYSFTDISGDKTVPQIGGGDVWLVKLDALGNIQWQKAIGGTGADLPSSFSATSDGGYILAVQSDSNTSADKSENSLGGTDFWIVKLNADGTIAWENTIGGAADDNLPKIAEALDGGFIVGGTSASNISGDKTENNLGLTDYWALKLDASGSILWQNTIGGSDGDNINDVLAMADGGYILGGNSLSNISGDKSENNIGAIDYWIVKLNATGDVVWDKTIGGDAPDNFSFLLQKNSNTIVVGGSSQSGLSGDKTEPNVGMYDLWLLTLDSNGEIQSQKTLGGNDSDLAADAIISSSGKYIVALTSYSSISGDKTEDSMGLADYWVLLLDENLQLLEQNTLGGSSQDFMGSLIEDSSSIVIVVGSSVSNISGDKTENSLGSYDAWVIQLNNFALSIEETSLSEFVIYPNPAGDAVNFSIQNSVFEHIEIYDALGRSIKRYAPTTNFFTVDISNFSSGLYFCEIVANGKKSVQRFLKN